MRLRRRSVAAHARHGTEVVEYHGLLAYRADRARLLQRSFEMGFRLAQRSLGKINQTEVTLCTRAYQCVSLGAMERIGEVGARRGVVAQHVLCGAPGHLPEGFPFATELAG